ncbi:SDR family NAD(P)-dependent oxidoreductase, partial [Citrobacter freundii]
MATHLFDLTGKIALVTGASRGIGEEIAKLLAEQGAHVIVSSRKVEDCQRVANEIIAANGKAEAFACHVGKLEDIAEIFEYIRKEHGRLDILVNNAAANPYFGHILDT